jgi:hypothetical protein
MATRGAFCSGGSILRHCFVHIFHTRRLPSREAETSSELSSDTERAVTAFVWPARVATMAGRGWKGMRTSTDQGRERVAGLVREQVSLIALECLIKVWHAFLKGEVWREEA